MERALSSLDMNPRFESLPCADGTRVIIAIVRDFLEVLVELSPIWRCGVLVCGEWLSFIIELAGWGSEIKIKGFLL